MECLQTAATFLDKIGRTDLALQVRQCAQGLDRRRLLADKLAQLETLRQEIEQLQFEMNLPPAILLRLRLVECVLDEKTPNVERLLERIDGAPVTALGAKETFRVLSLAGRDSADAVLDQLKACGKVRALAEPTLVTLSGQVAHLQCGGEVPIPAPDGADTEPLRLERFGTLLDALPVLKPDGTLRLDVSLSVREVDATRATIVEGKPIPGLRARSLSTSVEMNPGQTLVLAGVTQQAAAAKPSDQPATVLLVTIYAEVVKPPAQAARTPLVR